MSMHWSLCCVVLVSLACGASATGELISEDASDPEAGQISETKMTQAELKAREKIVKAKLTELAKHAVFKDKGENPLTMTMHQLLTKEQGLKDKIKKAVTLQKKLDKEKKDDTTEDKTEEDKEEIKKQKEELEKEKEEVEKKQEEVEKEKEEMEKKQEDAQKDKEEEEVSKKEVSKKEVEKRKDDTEQDDHDQDQDTKKDHDAGDKKMPSAKHVAKAHKKTAEARESVEDAEEAVDKATVASIKGGHRPGGGNAVANAGP